MTRVLVTGAAGFIGYHVAARYLARGDEVVGVDNVDGYYSVALKEARLARLAPHPGFTFVRADLADRAAVARLFDAVRPALVVHMGGQAGVRYSLERPHAFADSNLVGFLNVLEGCRASGAEHLVYASSSSVYGAGARLPFSVREGADRPLSLYAATKRANELMAHAYSHAHGLPVTGLRLFTVYGPWGRPDMAYFKFTEAILAGRAIDVYNHGEMRRDFTYVDDVAEGVVRVGDLRPSPEPARDGDGTAGAAPYRIYNVGNHAPVPLLRFIETLERCLGRTAAKRFLPMQAGDVPETFADVSELAAATGFAPATPLEEGLRRFVDWYREFYAVPDAR